MKKISELILITLVSMFSVNVFCAVSASKENIANNKADTYYPEQATAVDIFSYKLAYYYAMEFSYAAYDGHYNQEDPNTIDPFEQWYEYGQDRYFGNDRYTVLSDQNDDYPPYSTKDGGWTVDRYYYNSSDSIKKSLLKPRYGFILAKKKFTDGVTAFVLSYRGTFKNYNVLVDLDATPKMLSKKKCWYVHSGFYKYFESSLTYKNSNNESVIKKFLTDFKENYNKPVAENGAKLKNPAVLIITGHSLGAGVVPIAAFYAVNKLSINGKYMYLCGIAEPAPVNKGFAKSFIKSFPVPDKQVVYFANEGSNAKDPIPNLPYAAGYHHFGNKIKISVTPVDGNGTCNMNWHNPFWYEIGIKNRYCPFASFEKTNI